MYPNCLKDLVGLVHTPTECFTGSTISNVSTLDLFVTQDPAYDNCKLKGGDTQCELYKLMAELREEALRQVTVDIGAILNNRVKTRNDCDYFIGQNQVGSYYSPSLVPANPKLEITTLNQPGAYIRIDQIALMIAPIGGSITVPLKISKVYSLLDTEEIRTYNIEIERFSTFPKAVAPSTILPCDGSTYRVEYPFNGLTMNVPTSNYHCGCGGKLKCARGFIIENVSETYGISLHTTMRCEDGRAVCSLLKSDTYRMVLAYMIRKLIIKLLLEKISNRQDVNRFTLLSSEDTSAQIGLYNEEYNSRLAWIGQQSDFDFDGFCLSCNTGFGGKKFNLLTGR